MRSLLRVIALLFVVLGATLSAASAAGFSLFSRRWGNVIVATDTTKAGSELAPPAPGKPVYYLGRTLGARLGSIPGDRMPDEQEMGQFIADVLAKQGYLGAKAGLPPPSLYVVLQWGYLTPGSGELPWFLGYNPAQDIGAPAFPGLLGPEVWRRGFRSRTTTTILDYAGTPIYGIILTAFEYDSADTPRPVIYWQTRIALPANGKSMAEALPAMALAAGPAIGRKSDSPALLDVDEARETRVELGELEFRGVVEEPSPRDRRSDAKP